jgi:hypothetical protein
VLQLNFSQLPTANYELYVEDVSKTNVRMFFWVNDMGFSLPSGTEEDVPVLPVGSVKDKRDSIVATGTSPLFD